MKNELSSEKQMRIRKLHKRGRSREWLATHYDVPVDFINQIIEPFIDKSKYTACHNIRTVVEYIEAEPEKKVTKKKVTKKKISKDTVDNKRIKTEEIDNKTINIDKDI